MLAAGSKVMFCNLVDDPFYGVPGQDSNQPWILAGKERNYQEFESKLLGLQNMDERTWTLQTQKIAQEYVRVNRKDLSTDVLRKTLRDMIEQ